MKRLRGFRLALVLAGAVALFWPARFGGIVGLTMVAGDSMEPGMNSGDLAVTVRQPSYGVGDPVVFEMPGLEQRYVIHRIVRVEDDGNFVTRGDNRTTDDNWRVAPKSIMGQQVMIIPRCEHPLCRNLPIPVIFGIGLLGLAAGMWVYSAVRGPRRHDHAAIPQSGHEPCTHEGVPMSTIVGQRDGAGTPAPLLDATSGGLVGIRVEPGTPGQSDLLAGYAVGLLTSARRRGVDEFVVLIASPTSEANSVTVSLLDDLDSSGCDANGLAVELSLADLEDPETKKAARMLSDRGAKLVLTGLREGLLSNRGALRRLVNRHRCDALVANVLDYDLESLCDCLDGTESLIAVGVATPEQLEALHAHGLEWWSGSLAETAGDESELPYGRRRTDKEPLRSQPVVTINH
ncbi:MAG: S26 family signal peptidase [Microthrixaceae bacterium]